MIDSPRLSRASRKLRRRLRHLRRSHRGHARRAARKNRRYDPSKFYADDSGLEVVPKLVQRKKKRIAKEVVTLEFPQEWSVKNKPEEVFEFLEKLALAFFRSDVRTVRIDHTTLRDITPEAALILIAELSRLKKYSPDTRLRARFDGTPSRVIDVLNGVGYFRYFRRRVTISEDENRQFITHMTGLYTNAEAAFRLVHTFYRLGHLGIDRCKRLAKGLIECMQNVKHHAYDGLIGKRLIDRWWMCGYVDPSAGVLYFAFYDQGVGMPTTLRFKARDIYVPELFARSDTELMLAAFLGQFSRTRLKNRGLGLPRLKKLVDEAPDGEFFVQSKECRVSLRPRTKPQTSVTQNSLEGTLLVWQIVVETKDGDEQK